MLATGFPNDWLDQTMSYQLIQTTSFAMHPRLVDYITVALVWMHCSCLLVSLERSTYWFLAQNHLLNLTKAKRCRINLSKRHRFAIANSNAPAELSSSADCDDITADVIIADSRSCASSQLLIVMTSFLLLIASSRKCADVITADSRFLFASIQQLIASTFEHCSLLLNCSSSILLQ
ncbi:paired amphipathic helix protein Sin3-like 4 [Dorcoceras hygrometricum]|uniref:Paired amphipathic helix protein Sin3-like 4 n=1 Tax=Dorcoceras hygrometricum TaxID=472368 RepID=A0A2Z7BMT8_9LAMI|nr:paired amphipathic helix protein Sin3-like 4 [Dorcoceras hygrometricum]